MAKLDLSRVLGKRKKIRWATFLAAVLLIFFAVQMIILDKPKKPKASGIIVDAANETCVLNGSDDTLSDTDFRCDSYFLGITNGTLTIAGNHNFKWVYVSTNGVITHAPIELGDLESDGVTLKASGKKKIVSITATHISTDDQSGNIIVENGGKIDVDGKGYPGAKWTRSVSSPVPLGTFSGKSIGGGVFGWGPGGGYTYIEDAGHPKGYFCSSGGGGGSAGAGQKGYQETDCGNLLAPINYVATGSETNLIASTGTTFEDPSSIYPGSGGGGAWYSDTSTNAWDGGAGGGRVYIKGRTIWVKAGGKISADGAVSTRRETGDYEVGGGGGAGGVVYLNAEQVIFESDPGVTVGIGGGSSGGSNGSYLVSGFDTTAESALISAAGGHGFFHNGGDDYASGGGGGFVVINKVASVGGVTVKKTLHPVSRNGSADFNPYALQIGDIIQVKLDVSNINGKIVVKDEALKLPYSGTTTCVPISASITDPSGSIVGSTVIFDYTPGPVTDHAFTYNCQVT